MNKLHKLYQDINHRSNSFENYDELVVPTSCEVTCKAPEPVGEPFYVNLFSFSAASTTNTVTMIYGRGLEWNDFEGVYVATDNIGSDKQQITLEKGVEQEFTFVKSTTTFYVGVIQLGEDLYDATDKALRKYSDGSLSHTMLPYFTTRSSKCVLDNNIVYYTDDINILKSTLKSNQIIFPYTIKPDYAPFGIDYLFDGMASYVSNEGAEYSIHISTPQNDYNMRNTTYVSMSWERAGLPETTEWVDINYKLGFSRIPVESPIYAKEWAEEFMSDKKWTTSIFRFPTGSQEYRTELGYK